MTVFAREYRWTLIFLAITVLLGIMLVLVSYQAVGTLARARVVEALKPAIQDQAIYAADIWDEIADRELVIETLGDYTEHLNIAALVFYEGQQSEPTLVVGNRTAKQPVVGGAGTAAAEGAEEIANASYEDFDGTIVTFSTLRVVVPTSTGRVELYSDITFYVGEQIDQFRSAVLVVVAGVCASFMFGLIAVFIVIDRRFASNQNRLVAQNAELLSANEAKNRVLATASHELNTPLTSIISFTDILFRRLVDRLTPREVEFFEIVQRNENRLKFLIEELVDLSAIEAGRVSLTPENVEIKQFVCNTLLEIDSDEYVRSRVVRSQLDLEPVIISADPLRLSQVVSNLISNSGKYSPDGMPIDVSVSTDGEFVKISVHDRGYGIGEYDRVRVFEPFFRSKHFQVQARQGLGLGLALSRRIVELHGGEIGFENRTGGGSTFWFTLPVNRQE